MSKFPWKKRSKKKNEKRRRIIIKKLKKGAGEIKRGKANHARHSQR